MRTIKFRAKAKGSPLIQDGTFVYGSLVLRNENMPVIDIYGYVDGCGVHYKHTVDKDTIGQFTGLYDKNGKEIYEGDIVKISHYVWHQPVKIPLHSYGHQYDDCGMKTYYRNYVVNYYPGYSHCGFRLQNGSITHNLLGSLIAHDMEVVGNYYDNPELLKGGQE